MLTLDAPAGVRAKLVIAVGNPSRGDDAIGPLLAERLQALGLSEVEVLTDFQLQVEHALDLIGRRTVVFVDASASGAAPFALAPAAAAADASFTTHALSPAAVLSCYRRIKDAEAPRAFVLAVRGYSFGLGDVLSDAAARNVDRALDALVDLLCDA